MICVSVIIAPLPLVAKVTGELGPYNHNATVSPAFKCKMLVLLNCAVGDEVVTIVPIAGVPLTYIAELSLSGVVRLIL